MDIEYLKNQLTIDDIKTLIHSLGAEIFSEDEEKIVTSTMLCHGGDSPNKLYYFKDDKYWYCHTHCHGKVDIISIVQNVKDCEVGEAIDYICSITGIKEFQEGFTNNLDVIDDWEFINNYKRKKNELNKNECNKPYDKRTLNMFQKFYTKSWIDEGISIKAMEKFNIAYSTLNQSIIIPHFDINDNLIGIRQRYMEEFDINNYGKYTPFYSGNIMYNHKLSLNLYGINENKEYIKKCKKVMLVESEKSVLQVESLYPDRNFTLALCGSKKVFYEQIKLLLSLGVREVIIALDRQYKQVNDDEYKMWAKNIQDNFINVLMPYFNVEVIWDTIDLLDYKDSPTDKGKNTLIKLMKNKIYINNY